MAGTNRMVEKSRKAIKDALLELMYEKDFGSITVNELLKNVFHSCINSVTYQVCV
mgnify:CR=1 FL=1